MINILQKIKKLILGLDVWDYISADNVTELKKHLKRYGGANKTDEYGNSPLHNIVYDNEEMVKTILKYRAETNTQNNEGKSAVDYARLYNNLMLEQWLRSR